MSTQGTLSSAEAPPPPPPSFSVSPAPLEHKEASEEERAQGAIKWTTNTYNLFCNMMLQNELKAMLFVLPPTFKHALQQMRLLQVTKTNELWSS